MAFPQTPLDVLIELYISGAWTTITPDVYVRDGIHITRGRQDEGAQPDPGKCSLTLNNRSGKYSPRNPLSPLYGLIGRNTPIRVSALVGDSYLATVNGSTGISTPDTAVLDITGDIDIRLEARLDNWTSDGSVELTGKGAITGNQRSWLLMLRDRKLHFEWSTAGTATLQADSTMVLPIGGERTAVRVTLDVNNGAGGWTATFYTAPSITGTWTQLGDPVTGSGVTSIFNSTAPVRVGDGWTDVGFQSASGDVYAFELRNGIAGSVVANPNVRLQTPGAASFADGAGRTWTVDSGSVISNRKTRFLGEIPAWPARWDVSGKDVYVPVEAAGILRRLGQGAKALDSTLRRRVPTYSPIAYWPMEEGATATQCASPIAGVQPLTISGFDMAADDSLPGSRALPSVKGGATLSGVVPAPAAASTQWHTEFVYYLESPPPAARTVLQWLSTGTVKRWRLMLDATGAQIRGYNDDDTEIVTELVALPTAFGRWVRWKLWATQSGANIAYTIDWTIVGVSGGVISSTVAGTVGRISGVIDPGPYSGDINGLKLGHLAVFTSANTLAFNDGDIAFAGETAGARMVRLAAEEGLPFIQLGDATRQERVGPQRPDTMLTLLEDAADVDGGILHERRHQLGLAYRDRASLYNQIPLIALDYTAPGHIAPPLEPVDDDLSLRNDRTVTREGGSSGRAVLDSGPLSVQDPPDGVGLYDDSATLALYDDGQPARHAGWRLHLGTVDEARYPVVNLDLAAAPSLIEAVTEIESGARLTIANPPAWLPPGLIDLLAQGYTEVIGHPNGWDLSFNCTPASLWTVGVYGSDRRDSAGSQLAADVTSSATSLSVATTLGPLWTTAAADWPFDILVGGERMTVTASSPGISDAFGRTVSNGWGSTDTGQAWTVTGTAADYAVGSGYGSATQAAVSTSHLTLTPAPSADVDLYVDVAASALATGASLFAGPMVRAVDNNNHYMARIDFTTAAAVVLTLRKRAAGVETQLATFTSGLTHVAGTFYRVRLQAAGTTLRAKIWLATDTEPALWQLEATDTTLTAAASVGTRSFSNTGNTNVSPQLRFDTFQIVNPQRLTVTRSVNGIAKAQTAPAPVQLYQPAIRAL